MQAIKTFEVRSEPEGVQTPEAHTRRADMCLMDVAGIKCIEIHGSSRTSVGSGGTHGL
jgi:hypothetical protein